MIDVLDDQFWSARELELVRIRELQLTRTMNTEDFWRPRVADTVTEMFWDNARLDALETAGKLLIRGVDFNPLDIAIDTANLQTISKIPGETYRGIDGEEVRRDMIVQWNTEAVTEMLQREQIKAGASA